MKLVTSILASLMLILAAAPARAQESGYPDEIVPFSWEKWVVGWEDFQYLGPVTVQDGKDDKEALKKKILEEIEKKLKEETRRILDEISKLIDDEIAKARGKKPDGGTPSAPEPAKPGFLGVKPSQDQPTEAELKEMKIEGGVRIELVEGGPADKAGLKDDDIILEIDGTKVKEFPEMPRILQKKSAGAEVKIKLLRGKQTKDITVKLGARPEAPPPDAPPAEPPKAEGKPGSLGVKPGDATGKGMTISGVVDGSPAANAGVKEGDVLAKLDGTPIWKEDDLADFMKTTKAGQEVEVTILRDGKEVKMKIKLAERK